MNPRVILDTGPWVALHCRNDAFHGWAKQQFAQYPEPFLTCEAVVTETCFMIERGAVQIAFSLSEQLHDCKT